MCTYVHTFVCDPFRLRLRHLHQVEFCSFIVRYPTAGASVYCGHISSFLICFSSETYIVELPEITTASQPRWLGWMCVLLVIRRLPDQRHSFIEIDHEIFSMVILFLPLIQKGQLSVSCKGMLNTDKALRGLSLPSKKVVR